MVQNIDDVIKAFRELKKRGHRFVLVFDRTMSDIRDIAGLPESWTEGEIADYVEQEIGDADGVQNAIHETLLQISAPDDDSDDEL